MFRSLFADETGFIISAELVLVATILVIGLIVGLSEVQHAVVAELNDVADAIGSANQSYHYSGFTKRDSGWGGWGWGGRGIHAHTAGSVFVDLQDACDLNQCMLACNPPVIEAPKTGGAYGHGYGYGGGYSYGGVWSSGGAGAAYGGAGGAAAYGSVGSAAAAADAAGSAAAAADAAAGSAAAAADAAGSAAAAARAAAGADAAPHAADGSDAADAPSHADAVPCPGGCDETTDEPAGSP